MCVHRLGSTLSATTTAGGGVLVSAPSAPPAVMPVFPLRPSASAPQYSPYSPSRFHIDKRCRHRCSWKCCSIALILVSVALTAMLAYFGGQLIAIAYSSYFKVFNFAFNMYVALIKKNKNVDTIIYKYIDPTIKLTI